MEKIELDKKQKSNDEITMRVFLVGCARSGTTLFQSLLSAHPKIYSFTESHFFSRSNPSELEMNLNLPSFRARKALIRFLKEEVGWYGMVSEAPGIFSSFEDYVRSFVTIVDEQSLKNGKDVWLEKTPLHVQYTDVIEKYVPRVKFIHIVRNGEDTTASLYKVSRDYPKVWGGVRSLQECISRWENDTQISLSYKSQPNHFVVRYENLISDPERILGETFAFLGLTSKKSLVSKHKESAGGIVRSDHDWVQGAGKKIEAKKLGSTAKKVFDNKNAEFVKKSILSVQNELDKEFPVN